MPWAAKANNRFVMVPPCMVGLAESWQALSPELKDRAVQFLEATIRAHRAQGE